MRLSLAVVLVCVGCGGPPTDPNADLSKLPTDDMNVSSVLDMTTVPPDLTVPLPDLAGTRPRAVVLADIDVSGPGDGGLAPKGVSLSAYFYNPTLTPADEQKVAAFAADPFAYDSIADDTCASLAISNFNNVTSVKVGEAVKLVSNGSVVVNAPATASTPPYYTGSKATPYSSFFLNPGIDVFVVDQLSIGGEVNMGKVTVADFPSELTQAFTASRTAAKTFSWTPGAAPPGTRLMLDLGNNRGCVTSYTKGSLTVPQNEMSGVSAGLHPFTFFKIEHSQHSLGGVFFTPAAGARTAYPATDTVAVFRFLSFTVGGNISN
jgi:hypothetical protein